DREIREFIQKWSWYGDGVYPCAASNPAIASRLQSNALVGRVADWGRRPLRHAPPRINSSDSYRLRCIVVPCWLSSSAQATRLADFTRGLTPSSGLRCLAAVVHE